MRCSLGWALHNEPEIERCIETVNVAGCWKTAPEAIVVIPPATGATSGQRTREPAVEAHMERVAGD